MHALYVVKISVLSFSADGLNLCPDKIRECEAKDIEVRDTSIIVMYLLY